jgi:hypothetical protein
MTGSEISNSACKGSRPSSKVQQQRERSGVVKIEIMGPTDQLRRLAIKNSFGKNKSLSPTSPLSKALSSSTSSLHKLSAAYEHAESKETGSKTLEDIDMEKEQAQGQTSNGSGKYNPYITRQELLHSLRRTSSNHTVGLTQTICTGNSSYIHHTPRHLLRTHFNPKAALTRCTTINSDHVPGDAGETRGDGTVHETRSLVGIPSPSSGLGRSSPMVVPRRSKQRQQQRELLYVGVELMDSTSKKCYQVSGCDVLVGME